MTDQSNKYKDYFDDDTGSKENPNQIQPEITKDNQTLNVTLQKNTNNKNETNSTIEKNNFAQNELNKSNNQDLENLNYKIPLSKSKTKKPTTSENNDLPPVEYFEDIEKLMEANDEEDMEYELVDFNDIKNYVQEGEDLDYNTLDINPEKEIEELEKSFEKDPLNYETLYKLICLYKETKKFEKLKEFRTYTQAYFPLSDDMWKEWIKDEIIDINKNYQNDFGMKIKLFDLFEKAYLKYMIYMKKEKESKYQDFEIEDQYKEYFTIAGIRKKFENILDMWGLDFNLSDKIWDLYLDFEKENYEYYNNTDQEEEMNKSLNIIRSIFRRRLSFPHIDLDIIWKEYKEWEKCEESLEKVELKYHESSQKVEEFINLEENFYELIEVSAKENCAGKLILFLKIEIPKISKKYYNYAKLYFEKALEYNCDDIDIWKLYIDYTKLHAKDNSWLISIMLRSCKCCFFCVDLWKSLILEMEKNFYSKEKLQEAYQSVEEKDEKTDIYIFSIFFNCRNYIPKIQQVNQIYSNKNNKFPDFEDDQENKPPTNIEINQVVDEDLDLIRFDFKYLIGELKSKFFLYP